MTRYTLFTLALWFTVLVAAGTGCASKNKKVAKVGPLTPGVTDIAPAASSTPLAYTPASPVFEPAAPVMTATPAAAPQYASAAGSSYQVKKGDTLFGIARNRYGDGKQWQRIASANPGLSPASLKAGQTIVVP